MKVNLYIHKKKLYAILSNIPFIMSYRQSHTLITAIYIY